MNLTLSVVLGFSLILIAYDIWVIIKRGVDQSISWQMYQIAKAYPVIPFALGVLMGHLFWVQHGA